MLHGDDKRYRPGRDEARVIRFGTVQFGRSGCRAECSGGVEPEDGDAERPVYLVLVALEGLNRHPGPALETRDRLHHVVPRFAIR